MKGKTFRLLTAALSAILAIVVGSSIIAGNLFVPVVAIVIAIVIIYFLRRANKDVTRDERTLHLYEKASEATLKLCVPAAALVGLVLFALRERLSTEIVSTGYVLVYSACVLMLVQLAFYSFYSRKY
jgi:uncharacterized membrane protein